MFSFFKDVIYGYGEYEITWSRRVIKSSGLAGYKAEVKKVVERHKHCLSYSDESRCLIKDGWRITRVKRNGKIHYKGIEVKR